MGRSPKFYGLLYFIIATAFVIFAIQINNQSDGWDFFTILAMAVAAIDYMISFQYFSKAKTYKKKD